MIYESESGDILMALTGESMITRGLSMFREPQFLKLRQMLIDADVSYTNAECVFQDYSDSPNTWAGGGNPKATYLASHPRNIKELQWMGIDIVSTANNHTSDFGEAGVLSNIRFLDEAGMPYAGSGKNLTEARAPVYIDTPKGRVALIAAADWGPRKDGSSPWSFSVSAVAGEQSPYSKGRPGYNIIHHRVVFTVDKEAFDALRRTAQKLGFKPAGSDTALSSSEFDKDVDSDTVFHFMDTKFVLGDKFSMATIAKQEDIDANIKWVKDARRMADWVIVSFHSHGASPSNDMPPEHVKFFAKACIDAGADVFVGHGAHADRGIELYKEKPIFYSLGNFISQNDTVRWLPYDLMARNGLGFESTPADLYDIRGFSDNPRGFETAVVLVKYESKNLKKIEIHPVDCGYGLPRSQAGRPILADPGSEVSNRVLQKFQEMSEAFNTNIEAKDGIGTIRL